MSLEGALLGLISSKGPITGYDLSKTFRASMAHYWHARHGQIYPTLDKLKRRGFVSCRKLIQRDRPNKKLYSITDKGRTELVRWLRAPKKPLQMKHEGLLKARFYAHLPVGEALSLVGEERAQHEQLLESYRAIERESFGSGRHYRSVDELYDHLTLQRGILFLEESIRWGAWAQAEVERYVVKGRGRRAAARK
jgi:PadR family transcriptional regulator, regulatory protein AphA